MTSKVECNPVTFNNPNTRFTQYLFFGGALGRSLLGFQEDGARHVHPAALHVHMCRIFQTSRWTLCVVGFVRLLVPKIKNLLWFLINHSHILLFTLLLNCIILLGVPPILSIKKEHVIANIFYKKLKTIMSTSQLWKLVVSGLNGLLSAWHWLW